jgi:gamma-glutamyl:cysteine ligase YbdK (ATP-grasp superfamily)
MGAPSLFENTLERLAEAISSTERALILATETAAARERLQTVLADARAVHDRVRELASDPNPAMPLAARCAGLEHELRALRNFSADREALQDDLRFLETENGQLMAELKRARQCLKDHNVVWIPGPHR